MEEKPFDPSKKKLKKARKEGRVPKSDLLTTALFFLAALLLLRWMMPMLFERLCEMMRQGLSTSEISYAIFQPLIWPLVGFGLACMLFSIGANVVQTGWLFSWKRAKARSKPTVLMPFLKIVVIALISWGGFAAIKPSLKIEPRIYFYFALTLALGLLVLGLIDWFYQKWRFIREMRMSAQEKEEELKEERVNKRLRE